MTQREKDQNLMIVAAVESYSLKHGIEAPAAYALFRNNSLFEMIRNCYEVLHTQSIDESLAFAEDVLSRRAS
jgi:hypothetical protein